MGWGKNIYELVRIIIKRPCRGYYLRWYYNGWHYWFFSPGNYSLTTEGEQYRTIGTRNIAISSGQIDRGQAKAIRTIMNTREVYLLTIAGWMNIRVDPGSLVVYDNRQEGIEIEFVAIIGSKEISYATGFTPVPGDGSIPEVPIVPPSIEYCEVLIGNQIWMCKNWDSFFPGSLAYDNNIDNVEIYGRLYTQAMISTPGFAPEGWHVPTDDDWDELFNYLGLQATSGGQLKEVGTDHWDAPNTGAADNYSFKALGAGYANPVPRFSNLNKRSRFWSITGSVFQLNYDSIVVDSLIISEKSYCSVRLIKDRDDLLRDKDGNPYTSIIIGNQEWIIQSLATTTYADGSPINNITNDAAFVADLVGAYCWLNDDIANKDEWRAYYNRYACNNASGLAYLSRGGVQETGWRVSSYDDMAKLNAALGGYGAGAKMKELGLAHWDTPNTGATNESEFTGIGGGLRNAGGFVSFRTFGMFQLTDGVAYLWNLSINLSSNLAVLPESGMNVRLVRDIAEAVSGWGLPSIDELAEMNTELYLFGVGGLSGGFYWSSSEFDATRASGMNMTMSAVGNPVKSGAYNVRACRSFVAGIAAFALRDIGPGGGLIFYIDGAGTTYYEAAPSDQSAAQVWSNVTGTAVTGTGSAIGTGYANTDLIINQAGHTDSAARICRIL